MAHYALVIDSVVRNVHVLNNAVITDEDGVEHEELGQVFLAELHGYEPSQLIQCSYNANFRGAYPAPGFTYDAVADVFVAPEPAEVPDEAV
jgi:hypothetical protein